MKQFFIHFSIVVFVALLSACDGNNEPLIKKEEATLTATPTSVDISGEGGSAEINIVSNASWSISCNSDWVTFSKTTGFQNYTLQVTASKNPGNTSRQASFTIAYGDTKSVTVTVKQQEMTEEILNLSSESFSFESTGGNSKVSITSNSEWRVSCEESWITLSPLSGNGDGTIEISAGANPATESRSATIIISYGQNKQKTLAVSQKATDYEVSLSLDKIKFDENGGSNSVALTSNTSWTASSNSDWITISPESGKGEATLTITATANTDYHTRSAIVTISYGENSQKTISIDQDAKTAENENAMQVSVNGVTFNMIRIEGGSFTMGATEEQGDDAYKEESPKHTVTVSSYYIGETEVTQELWKAIMGNNPSTFSGSKHPVEGVTWYDCQDFIKKLNSITGLSFRLPTEAEWEYAARGGNKSRWTKYSGSSDIRDVAWYKGNSYDMGSNSADYGTHNVGTKTANELDLYDMTGNVHEWCNDWLGTYPSSAVTNPTGPSSGTHRIGRGGSWYDETRDCRVSTRNKIRPDYSSSLIGLRLAQDL